MSEATEAPADTMPPLAQQAQAAVASDTANPPAGAEEVARRAKAWVTHLETIVKAAQADIENYIPAPVVTSVESEVASLLKGIL